MNTYHTRRVVPFSPEQMFELVADVESYPQFLPLCEQLVIRERRHEGGHDILIADMTVAYKLFRETFRSRVTLDARSHRILVEYLDGPFRHMENRWQFHLLDTGGCAIEFYIAYEFSSRALQLVMGAMFDKAFRKFAEAFEERAAVVYGRGRHVSPLEPRPA